MDVLTNFQIQCPQCGESFPITIDTSQGDHSLIEDCTVCCRPMELEIQCEPGQIVQVQIAPA
jgi:hypothetical protein